MNHRQFIEFRVRHYAKWRIVKLLMTEPFRSLREMMDIIGVTSTSVMVKLLRELRADGIITYKDNSWRTYQLVPGAYADSRGNIWKRTYDGQPKTD